MWISFATLALKDTEKKMLALKDTENRHIDSSTFWIMILFCTVRPPGMKFGVFQRMRGAQLW